MCPTDTSDTGHRLLDPQVGECVLCYVHRAVTELGCDTTLRWTTRFRELRVPEATALQRRMSDVGGPCDCRIFLEAYTLVRECLERDVHTDELMPPAQRPTCGGVRRSSAQPCRNWQRLRSKPGSRSGPSGARMDGAHPHRDTGHNGGGEP